MRLCRQKGRTFLYLLSGDGQLNTLAGLDLGLDEGPDSASGEEHEDGKDETEKKVEARVGQLGTDGLDAHLGNGSQALDPGEPVPVSTTDLIPIVGRANDGVLEANSKSVHLSTWE